MKDQPLLRFFYVIIVMEYKNRNNDTICLNFIKNLFIFVVLKRGDWAY